MSRPDDRARQIAIVLGPGGASRYLLDRLKPLLSADRTIELQGVYMEELAVQHAAAMPFVKELCRVTFVVREFDNEQMNRALLLRMRTARRALAVLATRVGAGHSFRSSQGSAVELLKRAAAEADITVFEPVRPPLFALSPEGHAGRPGQIAVLFSDVESSERVLRVARQLGGGNTGRIFGMVMPDHVQDSAALAEHVRALAEGSSVQVRPVKAGEVADLALAMREGFASLLVAPATGAMTRAPMLRFLREQIRCPVCLVREWQD
ncbi:MAG: hypothetical protein KJN78_02070 [Gammaproteobacteria bacterium]|nr:hypothetical protein [Gammaproteobacteria bacterium]